MRRSELQTSSADRNSLKHPSNTSSEKAIGYGWLASVLVDFTLFPLLYLSISWLIISPQIPPAGEVMTPEQIDAALASQRYWLMLSTQLLTVLHGIFPAMIGGYIATWKGNSQGVDYAILEGLLFMLTLVVVLTLILGAPITWSWSVFVSVCLIIPSALLGGYWARQNRRRGL